MEGQKSHSGHQAPVGPPPPPDFGFSARPKPSARTQTTTNFGLASCFGFPYKEQLPLSSSPSHRHFRFGKHQKREIKQNRIESRDELDEQSVGCGGQRRRRGGPQGPRVLPVELHPPVHPPARQESGKGLLLSGEQQEAISSAVVRGSFEEASGGSGEEAAGGVDEEGPVLECLGSVLRFSE
ncbi:uncharacterized protein J3R85_003140 [Psidium guajava]|nr:uncharacterized protein J3R85_003140 [Psidium guajava]